MVKIEEQSIQDNQHLNLYMGEEVFHQFLKCQKNWEIENREKYVDIVLNILREVVALVCMMSEHVSLTLG